MAGFRNDSSGRQIMFSDNVDFTGAAIPSATMLNNGDLLIGSSVAPNIRVGTLSSNDGSVTITNGEGTINLEAAGGLPYISFSPFMVGTDSYSGYSTIASAVSAAAAADLPQNVYIKPKVNGTAYTENFTLPPGVNLVGLGTTPIINGTITMDVTGTSTISNLTLQTNSATAISMSGAGQSPQLVMYNCNLNGITDNPIITLSTAGAGLNMIGCYGNISNGASYFDISAGAAFLVGANLEGGETTGTTVVSGGSLSLFSCLFVSNVALSGGSGLNYNSSQVGAGDNANVAITGSGTTAYIFACQLFSGTAAAITVGAGSFCHVYGETIIDATATDVITGSGTLNYSAISFSNSGSGITVSTQNPEAQSVPTGGTAASSFTAYAPVIGGTTSTGALQSASTGMSNSGYVLTSTGSSSAPTWQAASSGGVTGPGSSTANGIATWSGTGGSALLSPSSPTVTSGGIMSNTNQPAFQAYLSATTGAVTGDSTQVTVGFNTTSFDQGSNFNTGSNYYKCPVAGLYFYSVNLLMFQTGAGTNTDVYLYIQVNGSTTYTLNYGSSYNTTTGYTPVTGSVLISNSANDEITVVTTVAGNASKNVGFLGASYDSTFSGFKVA